MNAPFKPARPLGQDDERAPNQRPVTTVAPRHLQVFGLDGELDGIVPMYADASWWVTQQGGSCPARRAVIMLHGRLRNADSYFELLAGAAAQAAASGTAAADTVLLVPQFLASADLVAHGLPDNTLHWEWTGWMGGDPALGPASISSFQVLDQILADLSDRHRFPLLREVVIAGHSGGAQVVQRYAVVGHGSPSFDAAAIAVRYVVANPSSYVYFDTSRPDHEGRLVKFDPANCAGFADWKYGLQALPAYVSQTESAQAPTAEALESAYLARDVTILLGGADNDPHHPALDRSCAAMAQGPNRLERGWAYARYMESRHATSLKHLTVEVPGVGHDPAGIFASAPGQIALFGTDRKET
jgi:pimeloyl-ACP methyl ester carboxylesterase